MPSIDGEKVAHIAAGTEHSALVTGKKVVPEAENSHVHKILDERGSFLLYLFSDSGALFTWGWGEHGQLGLGDICDQVFPQRVNLGDKNSRSSASSLGVYCGSGFTVAVSLA